MAAVLRHLHDRPADLATVLQPFMPGTMARLLDQLGVPEEARGLEHLATPLPGGLPCRRPSRCSGRWSRRPDHAGG
jgi:methionyl-tRNA synthetase